MITVDLLMYMLDGQVVYMMHMFFKFQLVQKGAEQFPFPDFKQKIAGNDTPLVILGDPAYPLLQWLMKAFPNNGKLTRQ